MWYARNPRNYPAVDFHFCSKDRFRLPSSFVQIEHREFQKTRCNTLLPSFFFFFFSFYDFWRVREVIVSPSSIESFQGLHSMRSGLWTTQEPEPCVAGVAYVVLIAPRCSFILRDYFYLFNSFRFPEEFVCTSVCVLCTPVLTSHCTLLHFFLSLCLPFFLPDSVWISLFALLRLTPLPLLFFFAVFLH